MKVAFWNGISSSDGAINYVAAVGVILALEYNCEIVLGSNYISNHMLQDCFSGKMKDIRGFPAQHRFLYGSLEYCRALWSMKGNRQSSILELPMEGITIIYPPDMTETSMFYYKASPDAFYLLDLAEENKPVFQNAIEEADVLIVVLPQDVAEIQKFFRRFSSLIPHVFFVIEETQQINRKENRRLNCEIMTEYGFKRRNIAWIPKSREYKEACEDGKLEDYLKKIHSTHDSQYCVKSGVRKVAKLLLRIKNAENTEESEKNQKQ